MNSNSDFTTGAIFPKMVRFMLPILGALILQAMYGAVDLLIVGRFGTTSDISGVSTGSAVINLFNMVVASLSSGVMVLIGQYLGEKRPDKISPLLGGAILFFGLLSIVCSVVCVSVARPFSVLMQAPAEALDETVTYVRICGGGIFFIIAYNLISGMFRGMGDSKMPLLFVGIACVANVIGDLLLVAVFRMGVAGAAIATVFAQALSVVLSLLLIRKKGLPFAFSVKDIRWQREISLFLRIGAPMALQGLLTDVSFLALCAFVNRLGLEASSGYGVANKVVSFVMLVPSAIMQSMSSFVSQNVGANEEKRAKQALVTGMLIGGGIGIFIGLLAFFKGDAVAGIFTEDAGVVSRAAEYLKGFAPEAVVTSILFSFIGYFSGHAMTVFVMAQGLLQTCLIRLPMSYAMSIRPNASLTMIGLAAPTTTVFGILMNLAYYIYTDRKRKRPENAEKPQKKPQKELAKQK